MVLKYADQSGKRLGREIKAGVFSVLNQIVFVAFCVISIASVPAAAGPPASSAIGSAIPENGLIQRIAVFDEDDRRPIPPKYRKIQERIGLLYNGQSQILCTAFCVAPNVIATAAHCLFGSNNNKRPDLTAFSFRIEAGTDYSETRLAGSDKGSVSRNVIAGTRGLRTRPPMDAPRDWALAKLETPACRFGTLKLSPKPLNSLVTASNRKQIFQIAYHWDYQHWKPAFSGPCHIKRYSGRLKWSEVQRLFSQADALVLHTCDTGGASSGSPLLYEEDGEPTVVGINVGSYEQSRVFIKGGRIVKRTRAQIIANTGVNAAAFSDLMGPLRDEAIIETDKDLKSLQLGLKTLGLYSGTLDGLFGPRTRHAIMNYESRMKRPRTGLPTQNMLKELSGPIIDSIETKASASYDGEVPLPEKKPERSTPKDSFLDMPNILPWATNDETTHSAHKFTTVVIPAADE